MGEARSSGVSKAIDQGKSAEQIVFVCQGASTAEIESDRYGLFRAQCDVCDCTYMTTVPKGQPPEWAFSILAARRPLPCPQIPTQHTPPKNSVYIIIPITVMGGKVWSNSL